MFAALLIVIFKIVGEEVVSSAHHVIYGMFVHRAVQIAFEFAEVLTEFR